MRSENIIFINHGVVDFGHKKTFRRAFYEFALKRSLKRGNKVFFVDKDFSDEIGGEYFQNKTDFSDLFYRLRKGDKQVSVGFVGHGYQKNLEVLNSTLKSNEDVLFYHLSKSKSKFLYKNKNYHHMNSDRRADFFNEIDILLVPSRYESYCLVAREAFYCGILVIHSGSGGLKYFNKGVDLSMTDLSWSFNISEIINENSYPARYEIEEFFKEEALMRDKTLNRIFKYVSC